MTTLLPTRFAVQDLPEDLVGEMYGILARHFVNSNFARFVRDLKSKDCAILLFDDRDGRLAGFSTQVVLRHRIGGSEHRVVFSGDTIIEPYAWGSYALPLEWGRWMLELLEQERTPLLWMLISKGMRTYRFLPTFFRSFYPRFDRATPVEESELMHELGEKVFPAQYDRSSGLVLPSDGSYYLTPRLAEVPNSRLKDPHTAFFLSANPTYRRGSELLCLTRFEPSNLKPDYLRRLRASDEDERRIANA